MLTGRTKNDEMQGKNWRASAVYTKSHEHCEPTFNAADRVFRKSWLKQLRTAFSLLLLLTLLTGFVYPVLITVLSQYFFPFQANGSMIDQNGHLIGSHWIGQSFSSPRYFWGRPSATKPFPNHGAASSGSNQGPFNPQFLLTIKDRVGALKHWDQQSPVPVDLVTASGSGLDPDISPWAAMYQVPRIAAQRKLARRQLYALIRELTQPRAWGIWGEPRINVLRLNLALDNLRTTNEP